ncbi:hypothetical protein [Bacillus thuringiensis]|uniref:hypothetical protein n=1 Tax=Bacillus thuringiensis TaxID=1428 RepID=UPI0002DC8715|nr:hypothetical protein [Bacillus thuringiensis]
MESKKIVKAKELMEYFKIPRETLRTMGRNGLPRMEEGEYELQQVINFFTRIEQKINVNFKIGNFIPINI